MGFFGVFDGINKDQICMCCVRASEPFIGIILLLRAAAVSLQELQMAVKIDHSVVLFNKQLTHEII